MSLIQTPGSQAIPKKIEGISTTVNRQQKVN